MKKIPLFLTKSLFIKMLAILMIVGTMDSAAFSQKATQINFARGKSSKIISGRTNQAGIDYVIKGRRGQVLKIKVISPQNTMAIAVGGQSVGKEISVTLPSDNAYEFAIYNNDQAIGKFSMTVSIK